jgi:hypothetical protein
VDDSRSASKAFSQSIRDRARRVPAEPAPVVERPPADHGFDQGPRGGTPSPQDRSMSERLRDETRLARTNSQPALSNPERVIGDER